MLVYPDDSLDSLPTQHLGAQVAPGSHRAKPLSLASYSPALNHGLDVTALGSVSYKV